ncbi:hypothetical protein [Sagittula marina]
MGIQGIIRGKPHKATIADNKALCPWEKVNRPFREPVPHMLGVREFTCVAIWRALVYVACVIDA